MKIILASGSPRRKELLDLIHVPYEVRVSNADETLEKELTIEEQSKQIAYKKAESVFDKTEGDRIVIGADTLVLKNRKVYGKPKNLIEAKSMLQDLQNATHQVITSYAVFMEESGKQKQIVDYDMVEVTVNSMTDEEIEEYLRQENVLDKAGSYAIQGAFCKFIEKINGNYTTVLGLPIHKIYPIIKPYL